MKKYQRIALFYWINNPIFNICSFLKKQGAIILALSLEKIVIKKIFFSTFSFEIRLPQKNTFCFFREKFNIIFNSI